MEQPGRRQNLCQALKSGTSSKSPSLHKPPRPTNYRPALIIAQHQQPGSPTLLWALMITSATHRRWHGDIEISDLATAGLPAPSIIHAKIATIEAHDAERIGNLPSPSRASVRQQLTGLLRTVLGAPNNNLRRPLILEAEVNPDALHFAAKHLSLVASSDMAALYPKQGGDAGIWRWGQRPLRRRPGPPSCTQPR